MPVMTKQAIEARHQALSAKVSAINAQNADFNAVMGEVHEELSKWVGKKICNVSKSADSRWAAKLRPFIEGLYFRRLAEGEALQTISVRIHTTGRTLYLEHKVCWPANTSGVVYNTVDHVIGICHTEDWINHKADGVLEELSELPAAHRTDWTVDEVVNLRNQLDWAENQVTEARAALREFACGSWRVSGN